MDDKKMKVVKQLIKTKNAELESWQNWIHQGNSLRQSDNKRVYKAVMYNYIGELMTDEETELYNEYRKQDENDIMHLFKDK